MRRQWLLLLALAAGCAGPVDARDRLAFALSDSLGKAADPHVAFQNDSTHLVVELADSVFSAVPESALTRQARDIGGLALRRYERAAELDSVTVLYRDSVTQGVWRIRRTRTFPVGALRDRR
jgi:hypothetical protein